MPGAFRFLLIGRDSELLDRLRSTMVEGGECLEMQDCGQANQQLRNATFDCVLIGPRVESEGLRTMAPTLVERHVPVVLLSDGESSVDAVAELEGVIPQVLQVSQLDAPSLRETVQRAITINTLRRQLAHTEVRLNQALTAANVGIYDWDVLTGEVYVSPQLTHQLGYLPEETWQGLDDWKDALHPEDRDSAIGRVHEYLEGRTNVYNSIFRLAHRNGTYRWILSLGRVLRDVEGRPLRFIGVHIDITEQKRQQEELERNYLEIRQFAHAISHDLQEPLTSISRHAQMLRHLVDARDIDSQGADPLRSHIENIIAASERQRSLIADLQIYTSLESEALPLEEVDCRALVEVVRRDLQENIAREAAEVVVGDLPRVRGPRRRLYLLFEALIQNALQFRDPNRPPRISVSATDCGMGFWQFCVADNGIGVALEHRQAIFQVFHRLHYRDEHAGNGIGLSLCRRIVERLGGCIWVEAAKDGGSVFCFTVPKEPANHSRTSS